VAVLAWLSLAYAAVLVVALALRLPAVLRLLWAIGVALDDVERTRGSIAAHTSAVEGQFVSVMDAATAAAGHLRVAVAALRRAQSIIGGPR
jgi:hypothetical protein